MIPVVANQTEGNVDNQHEYLSLRKAAEELGVNRAWLAGHLSALKLLTPIGSSLAVRRRDLKRVKVPVKGAVA